MIIPMTELIPTGPYSDETASVRALQNALASCNPNAPVITEGCDCDGEILSLEVRNDGSVYLRRRA